MLLRFMLAHHAQLPDWLAAHPGQPAPWSDRPAFMSARRQGDVRIQTLRRFLLQSQSLQAAFMAARMQAALPRMLAAAPPSQRDRIRRQFMRLASVPRGYYPLMDYVNFKGEGTAPSERYQGKGWGLLQVLEHMREQGPAKAAFADAAAAMLRRRVRLSPPARHETRWLPGWLKRVKSYAAPAPSR